MSNQVYGYITDRIMEELERGCVPWHKPWKSPDGVRVPSNFTSKRPYRGVNTFLLTVARLKASYESNYWLTASRSRRSVVASKASEPKWSCSGRC
jgi:antirestriction protein ArdC